MKLHLKKCVPCEGGITPLPLREARKMLEILPAGWKIAENGAGIPQLRKTFVFKNFAKAIAFVNRIAAIAESQGHHPDIVVFGWNKVRIELYTHAIRGLHENDFVMAARIDHVYTVKNKGF
ncbi:MAG: 4a-hydroxytetrahydrobiopterin dehydratase [Candidatus Norongarragalinales archaeon]